MRFTCSLSSLMSLGLGRVRMSKVAPHAIRSGHETQPYFT